MKKIIIVPAFNEAENIQCVINHLKRIKLDFIIVNDCSTDNTVDICKKNNVHIINLPFNLGIGGAVQTGYLYAFQNNYDIAIQVDGDGQHDITYIDSLIEPIAEGKANMTIGSRFLAKEGFQSSFMRRIGINFFTRLIKILTGKTITDTTSGFRAVDKNIIKQFAQDYPRDYPEPETNFKVIKSGYTVQEVPVIMRSRAGGESSISSFKSIWYMIKVTLAILIDCSKSYKKNRG